MRNERKKNVQNNWRRQIIASAAVAAAVQAAVPARAGTTGSEVTISVAGSTALKNWLVKSSTTFTDIQPGTQLSIDGTLYPSNVNEWAVNGGPAYVYQLAPSSYSGPSTVTGQVADQSTAIRFEFHESGSVEGILEMVSDQIAPVTYVTQNVDRNPNLANAVWVNYNQFGGGTGKPLAGSTVNGYTLGDFYPNGETFQLGGSFTATFSSTGTNLSGGQNAVQMATSDVVPVQAFANTTTPTAQNDPNYSTPWFNTPSDPGYGSGNTNLVNPTVYLGTPDARQTFQSPTLLNMPANTTSPTGTTFGVGPWNTAGLANLNSQLVAVTATLFVANPGTGLTQFNKTDAQFLELTSRLPNGAGFNMTTRDVNSGTRNVAALTVGVDPTWATGLNDNGNGNAASGLVNTSGTVGQAQIGPGLRFSNKTSGGNELRPTVEVNRMSIGTLSINDANGSTLASSTDPIRALSFSDTTADQPADYVAPNYNTIVTGAYAMFQNEQFVTLEAPDANYGTSNPDILGDDPTGDVKALEDNTLNSVAAFTTGASPQPASPAAGLEANGYIPPQLMQVRISENGGAIVPNTVAYGAEPDQAYNPDISPTSTLISKMANDDPSTVFNGSNSVYGGSTADATTPGFNAQIPLTESNNGAGGNYLFGNFNQNGVRDFDSSVVQALNACTYLEASGYGNSGFSGTDNNTALPLSETINGQTVDLSSALANMPNSAGGTGATKGDLIVMGDYAGAGTFTGADLYQMAVASSLTDADDRPTETNVNGTVTFTTGTVTATASTYGSVIDSTVLNKNVALDYLNAYATEQEKAEAAAVLESGSVPSGATSLGVDPISGLDEYTFDPNGVNAFNKSDVNHDGVVDFNDAILVDKFYGESGIAAPGTSGTAALANQLTATMQQPVTGTIVPANLILVQQVDNESAIGAADLAVMNNALTGVGNANWYGYNLQKTGPGTIIWGRTGGTVTVYPGASFEISNGVVQIGGTLDPFSDNNVAGATTTVGNHVSVAVDHGAKLQFTQISGTSTVASLSVDTTTGSVVDVGATTLNVQYGAGADPTASIVSYLASGYNGGAWNGAGINSSAVAAANLSQSALIYSVGYADGADGITGVPSGTVEILPTLAGDAKLQGNVVFGDFQLLSQYFGQSGTSWDEGNFTYGTTTNFGDFQLLSQNFGQSASGVTAGEVASVNGFASQFGDGLTANGNGGFSLVSVPEPASAGLLALAGCGFVARRRRKQD